MATTPLGFNLPADSLPIGDFAAELRKQSTTADDVINTMKQGPPGPPGIPGTNAVPADNAVAGYVAGPTAATRAALGVWLDTAAGKYTNQLLDPLRAALLARTRPMPQGKCFVRRVSTYVYWLGYQLDPLRWMVYTFRNAPDAPGGTEAKTLVQLDYFAGYLATKITAWDAAGITWSGASWADNPTLNGRRALTDGDYARWNTPPGARAALLRFNSHSNNGIVEVRMQDDLGAFHTPSELRNGAALLAAGEVTADDVAAGLIDTSAYYVNQHTWAAMTETHVVLSTNLDPARTYQVTMIATGVSRARTGVNLIAKYGGNPSAEVDVAGWAGTAATITRVTTPVSGSNTGAFKVTATAAGSALSSRMDITPRIPVVPGQKYIASASLTIGGQTGVDGALRMYFMDAAGVSLGSTPAVTNSINGYVRVSTPATVAPAGSVTALVRVGINNAHASGAYVYADEIMVEQGDTLSAFTATAPNSYATISGTGRDEVVPASGTTWVLDEMLGGANFSSPSAWEYALGVTFGGVNSLIGQQHGYERPVAWNVYADGKALDPNVGTLYTATSITIERTSDLYHPGTPDKVATGRVVYAISAASALRVDRKISWLKNGTYYNPYTVMWPTILQRISWVGADRDWTADKNLDKDPAGQLGKVPYQLAYAWNAAGNYVAICDASLDAFQGFQWSPAAMAYHEDRNADLKKLYITPMADGQTRAFNAGDTLRASSVYAAGRAANPEATFKR
jgi:hypothetical protein